MGVFRVAQGVQELLRFGKGEGRHQGVGFECVVLCCCSVVVFGKGQMLMLPRKTVSSQTLQPKISQDCRNALEMLECQCK